MRRADRGFALLEVLIALSILGVAGTSLAFAANGALRAGAVAREREEASVRQDAVLSGLSLLTGTELDHRLGVHPVGRYVIDVARPRAGVYRIAVGERDAPLLAPFVTMVFRTSEASR
jgi:prepilin-type N-terminal cleavage/methylation domain-containing protein